MVNWVIYNIVIIYIYVYRIQDSPQLYQNIILHKLSPIVFFIYKLAMLRSQWDFKGPPDLSIGPRSMLTGMVGLPHDWG